MLFLGTSPKDLKNGLLKLNQELQNLKPIVLDVLSKIRDPISNYIGAMRALMMLEDTYKLDILKMASGIVEYKGKTFQVRIDFLFILFFKLCLATSVVIKDTLGGFFFFLWYFTWAGVEPELLG